MANYEHRKSTAVLKISKADGTPLKNTEVVVKQTRHKFLFGCAEFSVVPFANNELQGEEKEKAEMVFEKFLDLFNFATLPFYWARFEPVKGKPDTLRLKKAADWLVSKGCTVKGHPLCWHTLTAPWLLEMNNQQILDAQLERIRREVSEFAGLIDMWDVINEVVIMPIFNKYDNGITRICKELGRIRLVKEVFAAAIEANPHGIFLINDFNTSVAYEILIEGLLEAGVRIDAIGIQSHMHQGYWGVEKTQEILERFSRFNLPIHFTETTIISGNLMPPEIEDLNDYKVDEWPSTPEGEERQAMEAALHYKTLFAHPKVEAITWWNFVDGEWLNAPSGFITKDGRVKPIYYELYKLIKGEWWTDQVRLITDEHGMVNISGYMGDYEITCQDKKATFALDKTNKFIEITL
ncbi:glycoside hydrolase family 10 [Caldicellulosiruptor hydrothermalis 108]|uniref:Beta-xylanase n=1 Tax=Caldicellulosiruptor hydrothermalis (strain DSM 18901 / VKM B-2411 / 108) TaxID=632292 RepID=E4QDJ6_CALH1|nr:endo-1,4-beta-xylanase [Caldicellulosiruptor hydrothermalis]ADQ07614.1 glycoside hydrolase family 10 [Caldicellulosiruptor hydrothermalis 108]